MKTRNQEIKVKANEAKRTFTIRTYVDGKLNAKYRTIPMCKDEFESNQSNTDNDWFQFLRTSDYYAVK